MPKAIIIHGWEETPTGQWLPWVKNQLEKKRLDGKNTGNA